MQFNPVRARILWIGLSLLLIAPAIASDFMNDDHFFNSELLDVDTPFGYYDFLSDRDGPTIPWWAADGFQVRFLRPLASLTLHLDFFLSPNSALPGHLHSAAWLVLLLLGAFALFDRMLPSPTQRWAYPIFALGLFSAWAAGWISARHAIMGGTFSVWATALFMSGLQTGRCLKTAFSLVLFTLGLLSSESALAFAAVALLLTLQAKTAWQERLRFALPPVMLGVTYLVAYKCAGFGAKESDLYLNPLDAPGAYLLDLPSKMLALFGSFTFGLPAMMRIMPKAEPIATAGGVIALLFLVGLTLLRRTTLDDELRRHLRMLWIAVPVAMLPEMAGMVEGRGSLLAAVLFSALAAIILQGAFAKEGPRRRSRRLVAGVLFAGMLVLSPLSRVGAAVFIHMGAANLAAVGRNSITGCTRGQDIYQVNADSLMAVMSQFVIARHQGAFFGHWNQLGQAPRDLIVTRTGENTLRIEADDGVVESYLWLFRRQDSQWNKGTPVKKDGLMVTVTQVKENTPTAVDFHIDELSDGRACLVRADGFLLKNQPVPPVGESVVVPWVPPML